MSREVVTIRPVRGGCCEGIAPLFLLSGDTPEPQSVLFFGAKKRTKRNIHLTQALPYMEGM